MKEFKGTKGTFKDGTIGWKYYSYKEDERVGFSTHEIHFSDDGECVAEVVHDEANAKLIAAAPELLKALVFLKQEYEQLVDCGDCGYWNPRQDNCIVLAKEAINKALN